MYSPEIPSRRSFLERVSVAAMSAPLIASSGFAQEKKTSPNDRLTVGFIGMGTQNRSHLKKYVKRDDVRVVAVCDVDKNRRQSAKEIVEAAYASAQRGGFKGCSAYNDFRELTARPDIDIVVIGTPDHWHAIPAIEACKAKKDVFCEKPLSLTIGEAKAMMDAARKHDRVFQTGSQQRSEHQGKFRKACEYVRSGRIGKLTHVHVGIGGSSRWCDLPEGTMEPGLDWDLWLGPAPKRPYNAILSPRGVHSHYPAWRDYREYSGGGFTDFGAHHLDIAQWGLGMDESGPVAIIPPASETQNRGLRFVYENGVEVIHGGPNGITFIGTEGLISVDRGYILSVPDKILKTPLIDKNGHLYEATNHHDNFLECVKSRKRPIADVEIGARTATVCHLGNLAYWNRKTLKWDPKTWSFVGDAGSNSWLIREARDPWKLPTI